jgi:hypothetical protein
MAVTYEQIREWALALPGSSEVMVEAWGHPTFRVKDKKFASGGPDYPSVTVKASTGEQAELIARDPKTFSVAPYVGRYGWVEVALSTVDPDELHRLLVGAWRSVAPKKMVEDYEAKSGG